MIHTDTSEGGVVDEAGIDGCRAFFRDGRTDSADGDPPRETDPNDLADANAPLSSEGSPVYDSPLLIIEAESLSSSSNARLIIPSAISSKFAETSH